MRFTPADGEKAPDTMVIRGAMPGSRAAYVRRRDKVYYVPPETPMLLALNEAGTEYNRVVLDYGVREVTKDEIRQLLLLAADMI